ncbi:MAG: CCDC90 family protein [Nitrospirae bacterium YQR-1]
MKESVIFDTHAYVKRLKAVGFTEEQAEVQTEVLSELLEESLATKRDLKELENILRRDLKELENNFKRDVKELENKVARDLKELELKLSVRLGTIVAVGIAGVAAVMKLISH